MFQTNYKIVTEKPLDFLGFNVWIIYCPDTGANKMKQAEN